MINYVVLQHGDLRKYGGERLDRFLEKIKNGESFITKKGEVVISKSEYARLLPIMNERGFNTTIKAGSITLKYPADFYKTPEFGGRGIGSGTRTEKFALTKFKDHLDETLINNKTNAIKLLIGGRYVECASVIPTSNKGYGKAPKSDFTIIDLNKKEVAWISHKNGKSAKDFQQYGGLTSPKFNNVVELNYFLNSVPNQFTSGMSYNMKVTDKSVILMSVYGLEYSIGGKRSAQNVDEFHQGEMKLKKIGNAFEIVSSHKGINGEVPTGGYACYYLGRYGSKENNKGIKNCRLGVFPMDKVPRSSKEIK